MASSTTYLLTVSRPSACGFRADLRAVHEELALAFDSPAALVQHLTVAMDRARENPSPLPAKAPHDGRLGGDINP